MPTYEERLATFTSWPHVSPTPQPADLATAGFIYAPTHSFRDNVKCSTCRRNLDGWEPDDNAITEHLKFSPNCPAGKAAQLLAQEASKSAI